MQLFKCMSPLKDFTIGCVRAPLATPWLRLWVKLTDVILIFLKKYKLQVVRQENQKNAKWIKALFINIDIRINTHTQDRHINLLIYMQLSNKR